MKQSPVIRVVGKLLLPFVFLFALYVQFHGDFGPGGGFQAGVIVAGVFITYALIFGLSAAHRVIPSRVVELLIPIGVLIYAGTGVLGLVLGGNYLEYGVFASETAHGQHIGIFVVEGGVFITVFATMLAIFYAFTGRKKIESDV